MKTQLRVLVVDDDEHALKLMTSKLTRIAQRLGISLSVITALSAPAALRYAKSSRPDMIIADYRLPGELTGLDIRNHVQAEEAVPVHVVSSACPTRDSIRTVAVVDKSELDDRLEEWLRQAAEPPPSWLARILAGRRLGKVQPLQTHRPMA